MTLFNLYFLMSDRCICVIFLFDTTHSVICDCCKVKWSSALIGVVSSSLRVQKMFKFNSFLLKRCLILFDCVSRRLSASLSVWQNTLNTTASSSSASTIVTRSCSSSSTSASWRRWEPVSSQKISLLTYINANMSERRAQTLIYTLI